LYHSSCRICTTRSAEVAPPVLPELYHPICRSCTTRSAGVVLRQSKRLSADPFFDDASEHHSPNI